MAMYAVGARWGLVRLIERVNDDWTVIEISSKHGTAA